MSFNGSKMSQHKGELSGSASSDADDNASNSCKEPIDSPALPSINERLGHLRPSRELLEYYRKKIGEYDGEHEDMMSKLEQYKMTYEDMHKMQWELRQREEEISELQKALSDMQVYLFQEREHVLRLYSENDRLKIRELEDRKKIQTLLMLSGLTEREVSYFMKEPPAHAVVPQKLPLKLQNALQNDSSYNSKNNNLRKSNTARSKDKKLMTDEEQKYIKDNHTLQLQVKALQAQIAEQTKLSKEQLEALLDDRRVKVEEFETRHQRDEDKIKTITEKLNKTQDLLYDSTKDFLTMRYEGRAHERKWMAEKDRLLRELDQCHTELNMSKPTSYHDGERPIDVLHMDIEKIEGRTRKDEEISALEYQNKQAHKLADMYREQVIQLEEKLSRIHEEGQVGKHLFQERSVKMGKRLELMNQRYQDLERRRNLEVEGFKTDIKLMRQRFKDLERQLFKVTLDLSVGLEDALPEDVDLRILRNVRKTAGRSKHLVGELKGLKAKVYGLENDLRHL